jgi:aminoglycoside phosphotransferase (APT) family kinase protein
MEETTEVRPGEEIDTDSLAEYLRTKLVDDSPVEIAQFPAGSSNLTYLLKAGSDEYVLRRPPFGNTVKSAHDMRREFEVLSKLSAVYAPAPKPILFCDDAAVIGSEFYLMECRKGLIIRGQHNLRERVDFSIADRFETSRDYQNEICRNFIRNLSDLHALDFQAAGLGDLGKPDGYPRRQVEGWTKRYAAAKTHQYEHLEAAIKWLNENIPSEYGAALVHNDYKFDNIMFDPTELTRITAVLDWEMVTIGDPLMDLGTTLGYWMSPDAGEEMMRMPFNPYALMKNISRQELAEMYADASGRDVSNILFYYVFGTFKIAVIAQQIYARFVKGFTRDARFAHFDKFVGKLGMIAARAAESGRV